MTHPYKKIILFQFILCGLVGQIKLSVNAIPKRAEVQLDGKSIGKTPIKDGMITTGEHQFKINKDGYAPVTYDLIVNPSEAVHLPNAAAVPHSHRRHLPHPHAQLRPRVLLALVATCPAV